MCPDKLKLLIVEDEPDVARVIQDGLAGSFDVQHAPDIACGRQLLKTHSYDALVLDLSLPDGSGLELASELRADGRDVPILMLTARVTVYERVEGFQHGADDYLCKPFAVEELDARLQAIIKRAQATSRNVLRYADVELELITRTVRRGTLEATLSPREIELLGFFMRHADEVLSRERILEQVWGDEAEDDSNVLNVYVNYLRNKIEGGLYPRIIQTVHGKGYMLCEREPDDPG